VAVIRLLSPDIELLDAALAGADVRGYAVVAGWASFTGALERTRETLEVDPGMAEWGPRLFVTEDPPELVGWGGFKGAPREGTVEVGYEIAPARQGRGLATAALRALVAEAFADKRVERVIAHTLPERNASNRVLEKVGFMFAGEARERGALVWRYALARPR
jgi:[ribosomal protein S5]-alanine N-acetyltransferase